MNDCFTEIGSTPDGRKTTTTWRRTEEKERNKAGCKRWEVAEVLA